MRVSIPMKRTREEIMAYGANHLKEGWWTAIPDFGNNRWLLMAETEIDLFVASIGLR